MRAASIVLTILLSISSWAVEKAQQKSWKWQQSSCIHCGVVFVPQTTELQTAEVQKFLGALSQNKEILMELYQVGGQEYNLLAHMAVGILGRESSFFKSYRYQIKEQFPQVVHMTKILRAYIEGRASEISPNSRGPTQVKVVPAKVADFYGIKTKDLWRPENAAVATMGFLIEALQELKRRVSVNGLDFVQPDNYTDYLPYIYFGATRRLIRGEATPESNVYIQDMKKYMSWVEVYETEPSLSRIAIPASRAAAAR